MFVSILTIRGWGYLNYGSPPQRGVATWEDSSEALPTKVVGRYTIQFSTKRSNLIGYNIALLKKNEWQEKYIKLHPKTAASSSAWTQPSSPDSSSSTSSPPVSL